MFLHPGPHSLSFTLSLAMIVSILPEPKSIAILTCFTLNVLFTFPASRSLYCRLRNHRRSGLRAHGALYLDDDDDDDDDGTGSPRAHDQCQRSMKHHIQLFWVCCGFCLSIATAILPLSSAPRSPVTAQWQPASWARLLSPNNLC